jgi:L,D-transpeptidase catalytic domain/Putative peptidoglycan binding domain
MRLVCATVVCALVAAVPAVAQDPTTTEPQPAPEPTIAQGVKAGGVDLSGLTEEQAEALLTSTLTGALNQDFVLGAAGLPFTLTMQKAKLKFDAHATAEHALAAQPPPPPAGGGQSAGVDVPLVLTHSKLAVKAFVAQAARRAYHAPRDAKLRITVSRMIVSHSRPGLRLASKTVASQIDQALDSGPNVRRLHTRLVPVRAPVTYKVLQRRYPRIITIDRDSFTLRLFRALRPWKRYSIAVGMAGLETPAGTYHIQDKQVNPAWHVPNSAWAGSLAGQVIPGGAPDNPLKARWLGIANGVGIHGTAEDWSIGTRASHGCIRMHVSDVIDLYPRVPVGTTVLIK